MFHYGSTLFFYEFLPWPKNPLFLGCRLARRLRHQALVYFCQKLRDCEIPRYVSNCRGTEFIIKIHDTNAIIISSIKFPGVTFRDVSTRQQDFCIFYKTSRLDTAILTNKPRRRELKWKNYRDANFSYMKIYIVHCEYWTNFKVNSSFRVWKILNRFPELERTGGRLSGIRQTFWLAKKTNEIDVRAVLFITVDNFINVTWKFRVARKIVRASDTKSTIRIDAKSHL